MIKNERQYRITRAQAGQFRHALEQFAEQSVESDHLHPLLRKAQEDALRSQLLDLEAQINEYEALRSGQQTAFEIESLEELPRALIQARIAAGLTQRQLAERIGVKEQQIQRYEDTDYAATSFARLVELARALGLQVRQPISFETGTSTQLG